MFAEEYPSEVVLDSGFTFRLKLDKRKPFSKLLSRAEKEITWIAEVPPSLRSADQLHSLKDLSMMAISIPDNPLASLHVEPSIFAAHVKRVLDCEVVVHLTCRDLNRLAIKSRLLGLHLSGVEHILALTGDHPRIRLREGSTPVFDLDSIRLIYLTRLLSDYGLDERGRPISSKLRLQVGAGLNPYIPLEVELSRALRKIKAGAEFFITQLIFNSDPIESLLKALRKTGVDVPIFIGFLLAGRERVDCLSRIIGIPAVKVPDNLTVLAENYLNLLRRISKLYGPVGAFVSTLGRLENLEIWDKVFRRSFPK